MKILVLFAIQFALAAGQCTNRKCDSLSQLASAGNCNFYYEVEELKSCGTTGYLIGYGHKYCVKFGEKFEEFNQDGKQWINSVRMCLMNKLVEKFDTFNSCVKLKDYAFTTHVQCYINPGYGSKGICDIWASKNLVGLLKTYDILDFFKDPVALFQVFKTGTDCIAKYGAAIGDALVQSITSLGSFITGGLIG